MMMTIGLTQMLDQEEKPYRVDANGNLVEIGVFWEPGDSVEDLMDYVVCGVMEKLEDEPNISLDEASRLTQMPKSRVRYFVRRLMLRGLIPNGLAAKITGDVDEGDFAQC